MRKLVPFFALLGFLSIEACRTTVVDKDHRGNGYRAGYRQGEREERREEHHDHH